jgi:large subunit ribosomal protein L30
MASSLVVTQVRSSIGTKPKHRGTLRALGLHGVGSRNTLPDRPEIRGMIARVPHLVEVRPVDSGPVESGPVEPGPVESGPVEPGPVESGTEESK